MKTVLINYDVPVGCYNPTNAFRPIGVRVNKSAWVMPEDSVPHLLLNEMREEGSTVYVIPQGELSGSDAMRDMIAAELRKEVIRLGKSLEKTSASHAAKLIQGPATEEKLKAYQDQMRASIRRTKRLLEKTEAGGRALGVDGRSVNVHTVQSIAEAMAADCQAKSLAYAAAVAATATEALKQDCLPFYVLADALEEEGKDEAAEALRTAFAS